MAQFKRRGYAWHRLGILVIAGLVGCQQIPLNWRSRSGPDSGLDKLPMGRISSAQEADMQIAMGRTAEREGDLKRAMTAYSAALSRDKTRADAAIRMAILHDQQGQFRESETLYQKALALRPGDPNIYCDMGYSCYLQQRWPDAERNLKQALAIEPNHRRARNNLGLVYAHTNREADAMVAFTKAGASPAKVQCNLAFALIQDGKLEKARTHYLAAAAIEPASTTLQGRIRQLDVLAGKTATPAQGGVNVARGTPAQPASRATTTVALNPPATSKPATRVAQAPAVKRPSGTGAPRDAALLRSSAPTAPPSR